MKLIVGLGNPGAEYAGTRHNAGFEVIERLANRHGIAVVQRDFRSVFGDGRIADEKVILMRPLTYMNLSGEAVGALCRFYKIAPGDVWVVLDDVALPPGQLRLRYKGSAGGHNGLESVLRHLRTLAVPRIRIGVGAPQPGELVGHVLSRFRREELPVMSAAYERAADAVECALREGFETAMNRFNVSERPVKLASEPGKSESDKKSADSP